MTYGVGAGSAGVSGVLGDRHTDAIAADPVSPRRSGIHQFGNNFLAHERLAIIDPASGDQPLFNEDKSVVVSVNGEIYNYKELFKEIEAKRPGRKFRTHSDCEVCCRCPGDGKGGLHACMHGCMCMLLHATMHAMCGSGKVFQAIVLTSYM